MYIKRQELEASGIFEEGNIILEVRELHRPSHGFPF